MRHFLILVCLLSVPVICAGQSRANNLTPKWMHSTPKAKSNRIQFETIDLINPSGQNVGTLALGELARKVNNEWDVRTHNMNLETNKTLRDKDGIVGSIREKIDTIEVHADGKNITLNCMLADEWWVTKKGRSHYYALYQLAADRNVVFDRVYPTNDYGAAPLFMSIIPGVGQFYKGDVLKGSLFLGGCAATGAGVVFLESQRKACRNQLSQTHDINRIRSLSADEQNYAIARNVTIGVTAALYLYNLIDAAIAPGARRVRVTSGGVNYSF